VTVKEPTTLIAPIAPAAQHALVPLLALDPSFSSGIDPAEVDVARRATAAVAFDLPIGPWQPTAEGTWQDHPLCALLIDGVLLRQVDIGDRPGAEPLGPGAVFDVTTPRHPFLDARVHWHVAAPARIAVLDARFLAAARRWPALQANLTRRLMEQVARSGVHAAICQRRNVEDRILLILWHLAGQLGTVDGDRAHVPVELTHDMLGRLVGAQRPTVTLALGALGERGALSQRPGGGWVVAGPHVARAAKG
jgi:hypothetical protein